MANGSKKVDDPATKDDDLVVQTGTPAADRQQNNDAARYDASAGPRADGRSARSDGDVAANQDMINRQARAAAGQDPNQGTSDENLTSEAREQRDAERALFGDNPARGPDGQPLERGIGSRYQQADAAAKGRYHFAGVHAAAVRVRGLTEQLKAAIDELHAKLDDAKGAARNESG